MLLLRDFPVLRPKRCVEIIADCVRHCVCFFADITFELCRD